MTKYNIICPKCKTKIQCPENSTLDESINVFIYQTECGCELTFKDIMDGIDLIGKGINL